MIYRVFSNSRAGHVKNCRVGASILSSHHPPLSVKTAVQEDEESYNHPLKSSKNKESVNAETFPPLCSHAE